MFFSPKDRLYICHQYANLWRGETVPEWISIYYMKVSGKDEMKCNICETVLQADEKSVKLLNHIKSKHKNVYTLHTDNPESNVGFPIEFIHLNVLKDEDGPKPQSIIIRDMCTRDPLIKVPEPVKYNDDEVNMQYVLINKQKKKKSETLDTRKRSWVWKYFDKFSNIIYRCNLCHVVLSIKGCTTNNLNRHVRTRHPQVFKKEIAKRELRETHDMSSEIDTPFAIKTEEICASDRDLDKVIETVPEWISIYYMKVTDKDEMKCNICETVLQADEKSVKLLNHIKSKHKDVYTLHKDNPESNVGFRIEFIHLNVLKDEDGSKSQPIIIREMCTGDADPLIKVPEPVTDKDDEVNTQYVLINKKKKKKSETSDTRKRSWVWKYFDKLSNIIYRCNLCHVVLSIKGCNTNNMNRHVRTRHPQVFKKEIAKRELGETLDMSSEVDTPFAIKTEEIYASDRDLDEVIETPSQKLRRSWIWSYFERVSSTQAQCKLCRRHITHGGNATGNMNRHLKMIHNKTGYQDDEKTDNGWVWKVFEVDEEANTCKICQYRCIKYDEPERSMAHMLHHLKQEHGVVSGDQIITGADCDDTIQ